MLFALVILLSQALAIQANLLRTDKPGDDIEALCARKYIDLTTFEQLKTLEEAAHTYAGCSDTTKEALSALVPLIESGKADLCSVESIDSLRHFYAKYLDTSVEKKKEKLPKSLRRFVIAYGMEMSNACKRNMIEVASQRGHELLSKEDFEQIDELTGDKGAVSQMLGTFIGADDFFTPADLAIFFKNAQGRGQTHEQSGPSDKIFLQTSTGNYVRKLQAVCERRFKPIYEPLMMPVSRLANMGFNYKDDALKGSLGSSDVARDIGQWSRIVFLCEALTKIHIVVDRADQDAAEGTGVSLVRIVTEEEAAAIEASVADGAEFQESTPELEAAVYSPEKKVLLGDKIYDRENKKLVAAVRSFKTSKTEEEIFKKRLVRKGVTMIQQEVKQGHFKFLISAGYKGVLQHYKHGDQMMTPNEELVRMINEEIEASKGEPSDGAVSAYDKSKPNPIANIIVTLLVLCFVAWILKVFIVGLIGIFG